MGTGGTVNIPSQAVDIMIVPRFVSCLDTSSLPPISGRVGMSYKRGGSVHTNEVPLGFNPFIGSYFDFELPCFFIPAGVDYGIHGTSYSLISRSNRQLRLAPGNLSHDAQFGRFRDGSINYGAVHPYHHYEVWWR